MSDLTTSKIGTFLDGNEQKDAIHVAVLPVVAAMGLAPGSHVGLAPDGHATTAAEPIGIVDPYLKTLVSTGDRFYLFLYPGSITSLRHDWTHPAVGDFGEKAESKAWLEAFAERLFGTKDFDTEYYKEYGSPLELLIDGAENGGFPIDIEYGDDCKPTEEFWDHYEKYTGRKAADKPTWFSCAC